MSNIPVTTATPVAPLAIASKSSAATQAPANTTEGAEASADAAQVSVASVQPRGLLTKDPNEAVEALMKSAQEGKGMIEAHGKLDAGRVFALLDDEE